MYEKLTISALPYWRKINELKKDFYKFDKKKLVDCFVQEIFSFLPSSAGQEAENFEKKIEALYVLRERMTDKGIYEENKPVCLCTTETAGQICAQDQNEAC
jgi:hypothetical protein